MARSETIVYKGIRFRRYPDSERRTDRVYFTPGTRHRQSGVKRLHEEIWQDTHGQPIPDGHHVHHADHDPLNNDPGNLVVLTESEHHKHHARDEDRQDREFPEAARLAAAEWHRTAPKAAALHLALGQKAWDLTPVRKTACENCGEQFEYRAFQKEVRYCTNRCKSAARRASGIDDVDRICERCGNPFRVNRYARTRYCSRSCAARR